MKTDFIIHFFREIENRQIAYCILRNYEGLPEKNGRDIDILVDPIDGFVGTKTIIEEIIYSLKWKFICSKADDMFVTYICFRFDNSQVVIVQLDIWFDLKWRGIRWIDSKSILKSVGKNHKGFYIPPPGAEAAVTGLKELMGRGFIQPRYYDRISLLCYSDRDNFISLLHKALPASASLIADSFIERKFDYINKRKKKIRRELLRGKRRIYLFHSFKRLINKMEKIFKSDGRLIAFIGPDGSGKTTVLEEQERLFKPFFSNTKKFHIRIGIFPELKTGLGLSSMKGEVNRHPELSSCSKRKKRSLLSKIVTWFVLFYYLLEFFIGRLILRRYHLNNTLILFDRYFFDYFAQPTTRDLIWPLRRFLLTFIKTPDLIIHLDANPSIVYQRKQELQPEEIKTQNDYLHKLVSDMNNAFSINTNDKSIPNINSEVFGLIVRQLFGR